MDNRINEIRRKINMLRSSMLELETQVRDQIAGGLDCSQAAGEQLAARREIARLIGEWKAAGGGDRLPDPASQKRVSRRAELRLRVLAGRG